MQNLRKIHIFIKYHRKAFGQPGFPFKTISKPKENNSFHSKLLQNLRKTKNFIQSHYKTLGKAVFSFRTVAVLRRTSAFNENHCKSLGKQLIWLTSDCHWRWHRSSCIGWRSGIGPLAFVLAIGPLASDHCHRAIAIGSLARNINRLFNYYEYFA